MKNKIILVTAVLVAFVVAPFFQNIVLGAPKAENPASGIERGIFVHYPKAKGGGTSQPASDQIGDFKYSGICWIGLNPQVKYLINPTNPVGLNEADVVAATQRAFDEWNLKQTDGDSNISFIFDGLTNIDVPANPIRDNKNTISWEPLKNTYSNAIAITFYWYSRANKGLLETDTVFNSDLPWSVNPYGQGDSLSYDFQNIATHEFGHWVLLGDLYNTRDSELTMYGYGALGETKKDTLGIGDILGIHKAY